MIKSLQKNYRPISVLPVISMVFETVICDQLCEYFSSKNLLCSQQYGFKKNSSTEKAALEVIDRLLTQLDGQLIPDADIDDTEVIWIAFNSTQIKHWFYLKIEQNRNNINNYQHYK